MSRANQIEAASRAGFFLTRIATGGRPATRWACKCGGCGKEKVWGWESGTNPDYMVRSSKLVGWSHDKRGPVCEECTKKETEESRKMNKIEPISNNFRLQRKVFDLLEEHFDDQRRLYRSGWSDKKVASEAGTSDQFVENVRREAFGELAEDPVITALKSEIDVLRAEAAKIADELMERMSKIEDKITTLHSRVENYAAKKVVA